MPESKSKSASPSSKDASSRATHLSEQAPAQPATAEPQVRRGEPQPQAAPLWKSKRGVGILIAVAIGLALLLGVSLRHAPGPSHIFGLILVALFMYASMLFLTPYFLSRLQNLVWNHTTLGAHRFQSRVGAGKLFWIYVSNAVLIIITLGLFTPFARVRTLRVKLDAVTLLASGSLDTFVAGETTKVGALGDAAVDWYDIDIAL